MNRRNHSGIRPIQEGSPLSGGSRQWDLKNDPSLPPITRRVVASPSLIETSLQRVWKTIYPVRNRGERKVLAIKHDHISARKILSRAQSILRVLRVWERKKISAYSYSPVHRATRRDDFEIYTFSRIYFDIDISTDKVEHCWRNIVFQRIKLTLYDYIVVLKI